MRFSRVDDGTGHRPQDGVRSVGGTTGDRTFADRTRAWESEHRRARPGAGGRPRATTPGRPGRPALLVEARGGGYAPGTPRAGWDHATPYVHRMLADVWGLDLLTARAELAAADVNPATTELRPLAHRLLAEARVQATEHARTIAERLRTTPNTRPPAHA
ncbi:hypothetical protein [Embleya sp. NPDC059259]|uniref:hypothetical protein n=1 Tax=unclassified Embleya TaxID=2699296 RepID=UPI0036C460D2